jgi:uncharacterized membrane protein YhaH (DUF805 family)
MNFQTAIRSGFQNYANFKGRATRPEYWWWALFTVILGLVGSSIHSSVGNLAQLVTLLPSIAVAVRRLHDTNRRGWWFVLPIGSLGLAFITFMAFAVSTAFSLVDPSAWDPQNLFDGGSFIAILIIVLALISAVTTGVANFVFTLLKGDSGENRFGPPPPPSI